MTGTLPLDGVDVLLHTAGPFDGEPTVLQAPRHTIVIIVDQEITESTWKIHRTYIEHSQS